jgi:SagB-type dehydrogenase family enzyme
MKTGGYRTFFTAILIFTAFPAGGQALSDISLQEPDMGDPGTLMQALQNRASSRSFSPDTIPTEVLSELLWAGFGINRPESGRRTAPSAINMQEIDVYVAMASGLYLYDPAANALRQIDTADIRSETGLQDYVGTAPVNLVFVADYSRMDPQRRGMTDEDKLFFSACDTGFISENVYLYCAISGLATVVRGAIDRPALAEAMGLRPEQHIVLAQTVGYPGETD